MTIEEAIKVLRTESIELGGAAPSVCRFLEALDMAISVLRQQETVTNRNGLTNAQKIRAMSDEELAFNIGDGFFGCPQCSQGDCRKCDLECEKHCLEWLQSPAEEDDHA